MTSLVNSENIENGVDKEKEVYKYNWPVECWNFYQDINFIKSDDKKTKNKLIEYLKNFSFNSIKSMNGKTHWLNVKDLLKILNRNPDHLMKFAENYLEFKIEKKTNSLRDGWYLMKQNITPDMIKEMIKEYCNQYVRCSEKNCRSYQTKLKFNSELKSWEMTCKSCFMKKFVKDIKFTKVC